MNLLVHSPLYIPLLNLDSSMTVKRSLSSSDLENDHDVQTAQSVVHLEKLLSLNSQTTK